MNLEWISAAKELPASSAPVLIYHPVPDDSVWLGYHDGEDWYFVNDVRCVVVTHWAHLPEPPAPS